MQLEVEEVGKVADAPKDKEDPGKQPEEEARFPASTKQPIIARDCTCEFTRSWRQKEIARLRTPKRSRKIQASSQKRRHVLLIAPSNLLLSVMPRVTTHHWRQKKI